MVISNATPLIAFARIGHLSLLQKLVGRLVIPRAVADESSDYTRDRKGVIDSKRPFLKCHPERGKKLRVVVLENDMNMSLLPISIGENHALKN